MTAATLASTSPAPPAGEPIRPLLGPAYGFLGTSEDGAPFRWDPCSPIRYEVELGSMPPEALDDIREALRRTSEATGLRFEFEGLVDDASVDALIGDGFLTNEPGVGLAWAPVLITFVSRDEMQELGGRGALGGAFPVTSRHDREQYVSGFVVLNEDAGMPFGFAHAGSLGAVVQHELGHLVGLDHVFDPFQLMSQFAIWPNWGVGDRTGLRILGEGPCLDVPTAELLAAIAPWAEAT